MAYASLVELKGYIGISDTLDDTYLQFALDAAQAQIDHYCDRTFGADANVTSRVYPSYEITGTVMVDPISTLTGLIVQTDDNDDGTFETTWTLGTDYRVEPTNAVAYGKPWTRLVSLGPKWWPRNFYHPGVQVTAKFGWPGGVAPAPVKQATLLQASRLWKRKDAPFGVAGSVEFGSEMRLLAKLDPDVESLLRPYRRNWWAA